MSPSVPCLSLHMSQTHQISAWAELSVILAQVQCPSFSPELPTCVVTLCAAVDFVYCFSVLVTLSCSLTGSSTPCPPELRAHAWDLSGSGT